MESSNQITVPKGAIEALQEFIDKEHDFNERIIFFKNVVLSFFLGKAVRKGLNEQQKSTLHDCLEDLSKKMNFSLYMEKNIDEEKQVKTKVSQENFHSCIYDLYQLFVTSSSLFKQKIDSMVKFIRFYESNQKDITSIINSSAKSEDVKKAFEQSYKIGDYKEYFVNIFILPSQHFGRYKLFFEDIRKKLNNKKSELDGMLTEIIVQVGKICDGGNTALKYDTVSKTPSRISPADKNLQAIPVAKILLSLAAYYQMPLGLSFLEKNNIKLPVELKLEKNIHNFVKNVLSLYFLNPVAAIESLDNLIENSCHQNIGGYHSVFFTLLNYLKKDKPTFLDSAFKELTEPNARKIINQFTIQFLTSIFLSYSAKQLKTFIPDKVEIRRDKIQSVLAKLNELYDLSPEELTRRIRTALKYDASLPQTLPQYLIEIIKKEITFGGSVEKSLLKSSNDFGQTLKNAADFIGGISDKDAKSTLDEFYFLTNPDPSRVILYNNPTPVPKRHQSRLKLLEDDTDSLPASSNASSSSASEETHEDQIVPVQQPSSANKKVNSKKISSQSVQLVQKKIARLFSLVNEKPVIHNEVLSAITRIEKIATNDSLEDSVVRFQQELVTIAKTLEKADPELAIKIRQINQEQCEELSAELITFARVDFDSTKIVANLLRIATYYCNTSQARLLINQFQEEDREPNDSHKRWQPQLSELIYAVTSIYQDSNAVFKKQRILALLKKTIENIRGKFRGKNSRLANTLEKLFYSGVGIYSSISPLYTLPSNVLQLSLDEQVYKNYIDAHPMSNNDNSQIIARLLMMLDYFRSNHFSRLYLRKLNLDRADEQKIQPFLAASANWINDEMSELSNFALLAHSQKISRKTVLEKIDGFIKKIKSENFLMPEEQNVLCASLSKLSSEYGGASISRSSDRLFANEIMAENLDKQSAEDYIKYHRCNQIENQNWSQSHDSKNALIDMAYMIILSSVYLDHSFGIAWLNNKKGLQRNKKLQGWSREADALALKMIRLYESKPKEPRQHVFLNVEDVEKSIRKQSILNFWGGVNSRYANSLEHFSKSRDISKRVIGVQHGNKPEILEVGFEVTMSHATAEDIIIRYAVHRVIDILSSYSNLTLERSFTNTSKEKAHTVKKIIDDFRKFTDTSTLAEDRKKQIDEAGGIGQFVIKTIKAHTHVSGGFHPIFKEGAFSEMLFGQGNSLATFLNKISPNPYEDQSPALCSPSYQLQ